MQTTVYMYARVAAKSQIRKQNMWNNLRKEIIVLTNVACDWLYLKINKQIDRTNIF